MAKRPSAPERRSRAQPKRGALQATSRARDRPRVPARRSNRARSLASKKRPGPKGPERSRGAKAKEKPARIPPAAAGLPGTEGAGKTPPPREPADGPTEDAANLEYAKKATDLALEYLKDQLAKGEPDQELLDELQWSREDMERFVKQWDRFKKQEQAANPEERKQFEARLEDLGLRPKSTAIKGGRAEDQRAPALRDEGRSEPPPEYRQQYRVFSSGSAKGRQPDGK